VSVKFSLSKAEVPKWTKYVNLKGGHASKDCGDLGVHAKGGISQSSVKKDRRDHRINGSAGLRGQEVLEL
jgi:hypothetical protein